MLSTTCEQAWPGFSVNDPASAGSKQKRCVKQQNTCISEPGRATRVYSIGAARPEFAGGLPWLPISWSGWRKSRVATEYGIGVL